MEIFFVIQNGPRKLEMRFRELIYIRRLRILISMELKVRKSLPAHKKLLKLTTLA